MVIATLLCHGSILVAIDAWGLDRTARPDAGDATAAARERATRQRPPQPSCEADAALATGARLLYCATPAAAGDRSCARAAVADFSAARLTCTAVALATGVSLVEPEMLDQIEPEPLLDILEPEAQEAFEQAEAEKLEEKFQAEQQKLAARPPDNTQIVEATRPDVEEAPPNTRLVSEYNSRVKQQTVARGSDREEMVARSLPEALRVTEQPLDDPSITEMPDQPSAAATPDPSTAPGPLSMRKGPPGPEGEKQFEQERVQGGTLEGSDAPLSRNGISQRRGDGAASAEREASEGGGGGGGGRPAVPNLRPTREILERAAGGGSVDYLEDVQQGELTALNTVAWKHASFFNRLKRRVSQEWQARELHLRRDPRGNVYGTKNRTTVIHVGLERSGKVAKIYVAQSCGVDYLDEEAVRAFRAAQPFPNPPTALADPRSGLISFTFGFILEIGEPRLLKVYRP